MKKLFLVLTLAFLLAACGKKTATNTITPTPPQRSFDIPLESRPYVSLIPREDGHMIYLKIDKIPSNISQIEYELLYNAIDDGNEIEKGVGDTIKNVKNNVEKSLLLGTESCTSGCKYNYDTGIVGGTITLNFITTDNQVATYEAPFTFKSAADIKKAGNLLTLPTENLSIKTTISGSGFYILLKNYNNNYSIFSSSSNTSKFVSITPNTVTKKTTNLVGDYLNSQ